MSLGNTSHLNDLNRHYWGAGNKRKRIEPEIGYGWSFKEGLISKLQQNESMQKEAQKSI